MKELVILGVQRSGALPEGEGGFVEVETNDGPLQVRVTLEDAEKLAAALQAAEKDIQAARAKAGKPPLAQKPRTPERWETAIDPVNQVAVLRAHFPDRSTQEAEIPRMEISRITRFLEQALKRFEAGAEMRQ